MNGNGLGPDCGVDGVSSRNAGKIPYIEIVEQPASKALRFRYECEGRSAGSIPGVHNSPENKTYPTIRIVGYKGRAVIVVSCVTKDEPYRAHPHNLVGKEGCRDGICTMEINNESMTATFSNLGIQCVKKKDIEEALKIREEKRVDPFRQGFAHSSHASSIDLNAVRLCFQAFIPGSEPKKYNILTAVVSEPIYDKKAMSDLVITKLSHSSATAKTPQEIILLCEKVAKEDIQVRFYEEVAGQLVWEGLGEFTPSQVHKQVAISFKTPRYDYKEIDKKVQVFIQMRRPSDGATSEPLKFHFIPENSGFYDRPPKRPRPPSYEFDSMPSRIMEQNPIIRQIIGPFGNHPQFPPPVKEEPCPSPDCVPPLPASTHSPYENQIPSTSNFVPQQQFTNNYIMTNPFNPYATNGSREPDSTGEVYYEYDNNLPFESFINLLNPSNTTAPDFEPQGRNIENAISLEFKVDSQDLMRNCPMEEVDLSENLSQTLNLNAGTNSLNEIVKQAAEKIDPQSLQQL